MRIPLVQRIRFKHAVIVAVLVFVIQQVEHTELLFSALCSIYILVAALAFNAAGGLIYPSGAWIFANATLVVLVGVITKLLLGSAGETNLRQPDSSMAVETAAMVVYGLTALFVRKLLRGKGLLSSWSAGEAMKKAAIGCFAIAFVFGLVSLRASTGERFGTILSALRQINHFNEMAILLATFYVVKKTNGRKSTSWVVWAGILWGGFSGLVSFSKQGMLVSPVVWLVTAVVAGHDFTRKQLICIVLGGLAFNTYLVPYSQVGRNFKDENDTLVGNSKASWYFLTHLEETRQDFVVTLQDLAVDQTDIPHLFDKSQGFLDRLTMLPPDDALIAYTNEGHLEGIEPTLASIYNVVPRFIWKDKPFVYTGNRYAHEINMIGADDDGTGVSFSPAADGYHELGWWGIVLLLPLTTFLIFYVSNGLGGDIRKSPWGILFVVLAAHNAPEGAISLQIYDATYSAFGIVVIAALAKYLLPIVTGVAMNQDRTRVRRTLDFRLANRSRPPEPSASVASTPNLP